MPLAAILCPWVLPMTPVGQELSPRLLGKVNFEFESSASVEEVEIAAVMKARLALAAAPLAAHGFSVQLPIRSDRGMTRLWERIASQSNAPGQAVAIEFAGERNPDVILALLTRRSISTLMESTALAVVGWAPQVCVGIDMSVPPLLDAFWRVSSVEPSADDSLFLQIVETACRQTPMAQPARTPLPAT